MSYYFIQCSARAAQSIEGHHRPDLARHFLLLEQMVHFDIHHKITLMIYNETARISFVIEINQTSHPTN